MIIWIVGNLLLCWDSVVLSPIFYGETKSNRHSVFSAEGEGANETFSFKKVVEAIKAKFTPSDLEQQQVERTGMTVDMVPNQLSPDYDYACVLAYDKASMVVNDAPFGPGVSDVQIDIVSPYDYHLGAEDFSVEAVGQEVSSSQLKVLNQHYQPDSRAVCCKPVEDYGLNLSLMDSIHMAGSPIAGRASLALMAGGQTYSGLYPPDVNDSYTDGNSTMTLSAWRAEGWVEQVNEAEVRFIPHMGGSEMMLRRV